LTVRHASIAAFTAAVSMLSALLWAGPLVAQENAGEPDESEGSARNRMIVERLGEGESIELDGRLDEDAWARAVPASGFRQTDPVEDADPSERTEVRILIDGDNLYVGAMLFDREPEGILAYQRRRDAFLFTDDAFRFILDTFLDQRTGYFFETNPAGVLGDGLLGGGGGGRGGGGGGHGVNKSWDGIWDVRTARTAEGWSAEFRIPFRTLNFDPGLDEWGINFERSIRRRQEDVQWNGSRRNQPVTQPIHAGRVGGLQGMSQGLGLEMIPYALGSWRNVPSADDPTTYPTDVGGDLNYNLTPSLRAGLSVNTDFAEVEVDQRRVNLTRFPLFFPEQRDFFLEGSSVYEFAPRSGPRPYYSRRIGLQSGEQIPIRYGLRLGGQAGEYEMGFQHFNTADQPGVVESEDFTVARLKRNLFQQSSLGVIYTRRATDRDSVGVAPEDRHTAGMDLNLRTSTLFGDKNLELEAFWVWNSDRKEEGVTKDPRLGDLTARGFRLNFPNDVWEGHLSYREFGRLYNPAVGFVRRNDFKRVEPRVAWNPRTESVSWLRRFEFDVQYRYLEGLTSHEKEEESWEFGVLGLQFESGDDFNAEAQRTYERLYERFEVYDSIYIEAGEYTNWQASTRIFTASRRPVSLRGNASWGGFWNGDKKSGEASVTVRPLTGLSLSTTFEHNEVNLPQGDFTTNLARLEVGWDATPLIAFTGNIQYDDVSEVIGLFSKLRWTLRPGNDIFFVFTHNWLRDPLAQDDEITTLSRGATIKANYTIRF
jgi:hypothetical protein